MLRSDAKLPNELLNLRRCFIPACHLDIRHFRRGYGVRHLRVELACLVCILAARANPA